MTIIVTLNVLLVVVETSTKHNHVIINVISYLDLMVRMSLKDTMQYLIIYDMLHRMILFTRCNIWCTISFI